MTMTSLYKEELRYRQMTTEENFSKGIKAVNTPMDERFAKALVNFDIKDEGEVLAPRGGFRALSLLGSQSYNNNYDYAVLYSGSTFATIQEGVGAEEESMYCNYFIYGRAYINYTDANTCFLHVTFPTKGKSLWASSYSGANKVLRTRKTPESIHGCAMLPLYRDGLSASVEGVTYIGATDGFKRLDIHAVFSTTPGAEQVSWMLADVTPKEIKATQAVNYGYNMLKEQPYTFTNQSTASGAVVLDGIIPYDSTGTQLLLSARPGSEVLFNLVYQYPAADVTNSKKYYVQWEIQDLNSDADAVILQKVRESPAYTPGDVIQLVTSSTAYKQFTIIAKLYYKDVVDAMTYANGIPQEIGDQTLLVPDQAIALAYYYLTNDSNTTTLNKAPAKYYLNNCTGMCTWGQRLVVWGIPEAKTTLFVSEINQPDYFPFPNNAEIFQDDIVACVPHMQKLLVFTLTKLYLLSFGEDGISYTSKLIQDRLSMTADDAQTVIAVQNMVYFKSGNYYYMVVPNTAAGLGELQLAPVSRPIEGLLDNFLPRMKMLIDSVYDLRSTYNLNENKGDNWTMSVHDFFVTLEGKQVRNIYKMKLTVEKEEETFIKYLDVSLNYDTQLRTWTYYMWENNEFRLHTYERSVTQNTKYIQLSRQAKSDNTTMQIVSTMLQIDSTDPWEFFPLYRGLNQPYMLRTLKNCQYFDTGYRKHSENHKKRYREIQFSINNSNGALLKFYTGFTVDDQNRKDIYTYETQHITDPLAPDYGSLYIERVLTDPALVANEAVLDTAWKLDFSKFANLSMAKVRFPVNGKGYGGSVQLLSKNETYYELLNMSWVYRVMYAR